MIVKEKKYQSCLTLPYLTSSLLTETFPFNDPGQWVDIGASARSVAGRCAVRQPGIGITRKEDVTMLGIHLTLVVGLDPIPL